jgi:hypothetical protein
MLNEIEIRTLCMRTEPLNEVEIRALCTRNETRGWGDASTAPPAIAHRIAEMRQANVKNGTPFPQPVLAAITGAPKNVAEQTNYTVDSLRARLLKAGLF